MKQFVKVGPKEKHLEIPEGWFLLKNPEGEVKQFDRFANVGNPNVPFWSWVEEDDLAMKVGDFDHLIRKN